MKDIFLVKIDSPELDALSGEDNEIITQKKESNYYEHDNLSPFGSFIIQKDGKNIGNIYLTAFTSYKDNKTVDVKISYGISESARGEGVCAHALKMALDYLNETKKCDEISYVTDPEMTINNHKIYTAQAIGEISADVMPIANYPSLSTSIKCGGKIMEIHSDSISINFLDSNEVASFSEAVISHLKLFVKGLCVLGIDESYSTRSDIEIETMQQNVFDAAKELIKMVKDNDTKVSLFRILNSNLPDFTKKWQAEECLSSTINDFREILKNYGPLDNFNIYSFIQEIDSNCPNQKLEPIGQDNVDDF